MRDSGGTEHARGSIYRGACLVLDPEGWPNRVEPMNVILSAGTHVGGRVLVDPEGRQ